MSTLSAFPFIGEQSFATPGAFNSPLSIISANIAAINTDVGAISGVTISPPSGNTIQMPSDLSISGYLSVGKGVSIGTQAPSIAEPVALTIGVNSGVSDYLYLNDVSNLRSDYLIGSHAGGTADGLNIFDVSGNTMIVSFSKQSIRFYQKIVGPVFDAGGAVQNVKSYGALGDGITDDTGSFALAHDSAATGDTIFIPETSNGYILTSAFSIRKPLTITGGPASTVIQSATTADNVFYVSSTSVKVIGITLRGNGLLGSTLSSCGIVARNVHDFIVEGCSINSAALFGVMLSTVTRARVVDNTINFTNPNLLSTNAADIQLNNSVFDAQVVGNRCLSPRKTCGIQVQPQVAGEIVQHSLIMANSISSSTIVSAVSNGHGIILYAASSGATVRHVIIIGNQIRDVAGMGIYLKGGNSGECADCLVHGNTIINAQLEGSKGELSDGAISLNDARRCLIVNNIINGGGVAQSSGIVLIDDCTDSSLVGNLITNANGFAQGGIRILGSSSVSTTASRVRVANNTILGPTGAGGALIRTQLGTNHTYSGNVLVNGAVQGLSLSSASNCVVQGNYTQGNGDYGIRLFSSCTSTLVALNVSISDFAPFLDQGNQTVNFDAGGMVTFRAGTAIAPTITFASEKSLGFYRSGASTIAQSYGSMLLPPIVGINTLTPDKAFHVSVDNASTPSVKLGTGTDAQGWYTFLGNDAGGNTIGYLGNAYNDDRAEFHIRMRGTNAGATKVKVMGSGGLLLSDGSVLGPGIGYSSESSLGLYRSGAQTLAQSYGTFNLASNAVRLSMRTLGASSVTASAANTNVATNEVVFTIGGASGASLCISSGGTTYIFSSALSARNT